MSCCGGIDTGKFSYKLALEMPEDDKLVYYKFHINLKRLIYAIIWGKAVFIAPQVHYGTYLFLMEDENSPTATSSYQISDAMAQLMGQNKLIIAKMMEDDDAIAPSYYFSGIKLMNVLCSERSVNPLGFAKFLGKSLHIMPNPNNKYSIMPQLEAFPRYWPRSTSVEAHGNIWTVTNIEFGMICTNTPVKYSGEDSISVENRPMTEESQESPDKKMFETMKFAWCVPVVVWMYYQTQQAIDPFIGSKATNILVEDVPEFEFFGMTFPGGTYIAPMLTTVHEVITDVNISLYTIFSRAIISYLRSLVTDKQEFSNCICLLARYVNETQRTLGDIINFMYYMDKNEDIHVRNLLVSSYHWPIKLSMEKYRVYYLIYNDRNEIIGREQIHVKNRMDKLAFMIENRRTRKNILKAIEEENNQL